MKLCLPPLLALLAACTLTDEMRDAAPTPPPGPDEAKVIVYRTAVFGGADNYPVYEVVGGEGRLLGYTETDCYFEIRRAPGRHRFVAVGEGEALIDAELDGGKTYYVRAYSRFGVLYSRPGFAPVGRESRHFPEVERLLPTLRCRALDPRSAGPPAKDLSLEKPPRPLHPDDGRVEGPALPAR